MAEMMPAPKRLQKEVPEYYLKKAVEIAVNPTQ
jgi:hypothetical protein